MACRGITQRVTVFVNGLAYCEARLAGSGFAAQSIWTLEVTKPLCVGDAPCVVQVGEDDTRISVDLLKGSATPHDLRIVVGLPGF